MHRVTHIGISGQNILNCDTLGTYTVSILKFKIYFISIAQKAQRTYRRLLLGEGIDVSGHVWWRKQEYQERIDQDEYELTK